MTVLKWSRARCHSGSAILALLPVMSLTNLRSSPTIWLEASEWMRSRKRTSGTSMNDRAPGPRRRT